MAKSSSSIMLDLDDPRAERIAEIISNESAKKILNLVSEKELSESEISKESGMAMNTVNYNVRKLVEAGLIEKSSGFLWSVKGKRIQKYKVSNKRIVITPRRFIKGVLPAALATLAIGLGLKLYGVVVRPEVESAVSYSADYASEKVGMVALEEGAREISSVSSSGGPLVGVPEVWGWFILGAWLSLLIVVVWNILSRGGEK